MNYDGIQRRCLSNILAGRQECRPLRMSLTHYRPYTYSDLERKVIKSDIIIVPVCTCTDAILVCQLGRWPIRPAATLLTRTFGKEQPGRRCKSSPIEFKQSIQRVRLAWMMFSIAAKPSPHPNNPPAIRNTQGDGATPGLAPRSAGRHPPDQIPPKSRVQYPDHLQTSAV